MKIEWHQAIEEEAEKLAGWFTAQTDKAAKRDVKRMLEQAGIVSPSPAFGKAELEAANAVVNENVRRITDLGEKYYKDIETAIRKTLQTGGMDQAEVYKAIVGDIKRKGVKLDKRAAFIARDQCSKASGALTRARSMEAGIKEGIWIHSNAGSEPRPGHLEAGRKKRRFDLATGLLVDNSGANATKPDIRYTFPGHEIGCRCVYRPYLEGIADE